MENVNYVNNVFGSKRVARRMSDMVYALLKSGRVYDRTILENAIERRREQAAQSTHGRPRKAFPAPAAKNSRPASRR